jgi:7tm Chemosensory receptor
MNFSLQLNYFNVKQNHRADQIQSIFLSFGYLVLFFSINFICGSIMLSETNTNGDSYPLSFLLFYYLLLNFDSFTIWILVVACKRMSAIEKSLKSVLNENEMSPNDSLKQTLLVYDKFCTTINLINRCFLVEFLFTLQTIIFHFIIQLYIFFSIFSNVNNLKKIDLIICFTTLVYVLVETVLPFCFFISSCFINKKVKNSLTAILNMKTSDLKLSQSKEIAALCFEHQRPEISCGIFKIDWKLLFAMITCVFSYLIILVQFDMAGNFLKPNSTN